MFEKFYSFSWTEFWFFITGPALAAVVWSALDYAASRLYTGSAAVERFFSAHPKLSPFKRVIPVTVRILLGMYFVFILLNHLKINSRPLLNLGSERLLMLLTGPVLTLAIWMGLDYIIRMLYAKSAFIEKFFSLYARVRTFKSLLLQACRVLLGIYFVFILLEHFNIDPKPLLAGIGVVGLGLSLAAQNILRDFLNGLFIILEDQFNIGDWVTIDSFSGAVESFTMRVTRLRSADGKLIIIPNGSISQVVNSTKDHSMALVDVGVPYGSDVKAVMGLLEECAEETANAMPGLIVDEPQALGIMAFMDNGVQLRVLAKTMPGKQWSVERALRMAIKEKFDQNGIKIPLQQIVVHTADK